MAREGIASLCVWLRDISLIAVYEPSPVYQAEFRRTECRIQQQRRRQERGFPRLVKLSLVKNMTTEYEYTEVQCLQEKMALST